MNEEHATAFCGGAVILHNYHAGAHTWLMQRRTAPLGGDFGLSAGGFADLDRLEKTPVGTIMLAHDEVYREMTEELPVTKQMFTKGYFRANAKPLITFSVRRPVGMHVCTFFSLELGPDAFTKVLYSVPDEKEVAALLGVPFLPSKPEGWPCTFEEVRSFYPLFRYEHELLPLLVLTNRLNGFGDTSYDYPSLLPTTE